MSERSTNQAITQFDDPAWKSLIHSFNGKIECPVCGKRKMKKAYEELYHSGIGLHLRSVHPEMASEFFLAARKIKQKEINRIAEDRLKQLKEKRDRPLRRFTVTGEFLDEIKDELNSLIDCMEPYYSQSDCDKGARALIDRIDNMHVESRGETQ